VPLFDYSGQLPSGALLQGTIEAAEHSAAEQALAQMGVRVTTLRPAQCTAFVAPLSLADLTFFNDQLAALTKAGLPLEQGLRQMASDVGSRKLKRLLTDLANDLAAGTPLPQALERQKRRFPPQYGAVVEAGLKTGDLSGTLYGLTTHLRLKSGFRRAILEVLAYPLVVLILVLGVSSFLMHRVVPLLEGLFGDLVSEAGSWEGPVPGARAFIFTLAGAWPVIELLLAAFIVLVLVLFGVTLLPGTRPFRERLLRHIPGVAQVYWSSVLARFAHTSALAAYTGTTLPDLVIASGAASGSPALTGTTRRVAEKLANGEALSQAAAGERDLPALWTCAVQVAAPRGDLPGALAELARTYELRAQQHVNVVRTVLGPLLFLLMAIMIGGLIASLLAVVSMFLKSMMSLTTF
jgi:type IV pilus assembly protein PilC